MKHTTGPRRGRPRGNGKRFSSGGKNQTFESTGPEVKLRGSAQQLHEKYLSLARDALSTGDRISAEGYFQFADHYFRIVSANSGGNGQARPDRNNQQAQPGDSTDGESFEGDNETGTAAAVPGPEGKAAAPKPETQAEERTEAVLRVEEPSVAAEASGEEAQAKAGEADGGAAEEAPKRRRRSPLGVGRRTSSRTRKTEPKAEKTEEAVKAEAPVDAKTEAGEAAPVKPVRRRTRKKVEVAAPESA
jgi:hypothetical protein